MSWFLAFAGFALLIILHELGHFAAAKAVGMRVERLSLFFGPMLLKVRRGETEYGIGPIPLGGYVKITGMNPREQLAPDVAPRAYHRQPVWKRIVVISAGPAVNLVLAFMIIWALLLSQGVSREAVAVYQVDRHGAAHGQLAPNDRLLSVDGLPGYQAGASPALVLARAKAISVDIAGHRCAGTPRAGCRSSAPAHLVVQRGHRTVALDIHPRYDPARGRTRLGLAFGETQAVGPAHAARLAVSGMWQVTTDTVSAIGRRFTHPQDKRLLGTVGAYETTRQAITLGLPDALRILALISLSLAVVNLFPFLPLDGGHIFWAVAEKVRGRAIPFEIMERVGFVGFALVIFLAISGLTNDISRLQGQGFGVR